MSMSSGPLVSGAGEAMIHGQCPALRSGGECSKENKAWQDACKSVRRGEGAVLVGWLDGPPRWVTLKQSQLEMGGIAFQAEETVGSGECSPPL